MYCNKCGNQIGDDKLFCNKCGNPIKKDAKDSARPPLTPLPKSMSRLSPGARIAMIIGGVVLVLAIPISMALNKSKREKAEALAQQYAQVAAQAEQERIEAQIEGVKGTIQSYAAAMQSLDFEYAAEFWVPTKGNNAKTANEMFAEIPYGSTIKSVLPFIGNIGEFEYAIVLMDDITLSDDKANVKAGIWMDSALGIASSQKLCTIRLKQVDDAWLIDSITEIKG